MASYNDVDKVEISEDISEFNGNEDEFEIEPAIHLVNGINLNDIINTGATFEINTEHCNEDDDVAPRDVLLSHSHFNDCMGIDEDENVDKYPDLSPFEKLALKMTNVDAKGWVKKRILHEGDGETIPDNAHVTLHYEGYLEYADESFDTTRCSGPRSYRLGNGNMLPGLEIAVCSMQKQEVAQFVIEPNYAYGKWGVVDLIPPDSKVMFKVEVIKVIDSVTGDIYEKMTKVEQKKFSSVKRVAAFHQNKAKDFFAKGNVKSAIKSYNTSINILESAQLEDMSEQGEQQKILLKLYTNLTVCFNARELPRKTCIAWHRIQAITADRTFQPPAKAYFQHGRALSVLGDLQFARAQLLRAKAMEPNNRPIANELALVEQKIADSRAVDKQFYQRAMGTQDVKKQEVVLDLDPVFVQKTKAFIANFKASDDTLQGLPDALCSDEVKCFEMHAQDAGLFFRKLEEDDTISYYISKE